MKSFNRLKTDKKLVLIGGAPFASEYVQAIEKEAGDNVVLPGFCYDREILRDIWCNCYAYIHGNEVGGTNPALLQAMANRNYILARDVTFNRDVLSNCGQYYDKDVDALVSKMQWTLDHPEQMERGRNKAVQRIREKYNWDDVAVAYEKLFQAIKNGEHPWRSRGKI